MEGARSIRAETTNQSAHITTERALATIRSGALAIKSGTDTSTPAQFVERLRHDHRIRTHPTRITACGYKEQWLAEILNDGVRVYGAKDSEGFFYFWVGDEDEPTHTGIVVKIERIGEK